MFLGFIPFLIPALALLMSFRGADRAARALWWVSLLILVVWALHHGSHHVPQFATYGAW